MFSAEKQNNITCLFRIGLALLERLVLAVSLSNEHQPPLLRDFPGIRYWILVDGYLLGEERRVY